MQALGQNSSQPRLFDFNLPKKHIPEVLEKVFWATIIPFHPITGFITGRLADFFCLEQITHGTSLPNYLNIRVHGFDPKFGGGSNGSSKGIAVVSSSGSKLCCDNSTGFVHGFRDGLAYKEGSLRYRIAFFFCTKMHAVFSGITQGSQKNICIRLIVKIANVVAAIFTPTITCMYLPEEIDRIFENDPDYGGEALRTKQKIGTDRIDFRGVLEHGFRGNYLDRIQKNKQKFTLGVIGLINPLGLLTLLIVGVYHIVVSTKNIFK